MYLPLSQVTAPWPQSPGLIAVLDQRGAGPTAGGAAGGCVRARNDRGAQIKLAQDRLVAILFQIALPACSKFWLGDLLHQSW